MNKKDIDKSAFLREYEARMVSAIMKSYPKSDKKHVRNIVRKKMSEQLMNPTVRVENSYTKEAQATTLLSVIDYTMERKPIIGANATLFKQHSESINPNAVMLDNFDKERAAEKKLMFAAEGVDHIQYNIHNIDQTNKKKLSNSWYGGSAMPSSAFYNKECAASTTKTARSVISTCMTTFEAVLGDTFTFVDCQEFFNWTENVLGGDIPDVDDWVIRKTSDDVFGRLFDRIIVKEEHDEELVLNYLKNRSAKELTILYWKYNLFEFTREHAQVRDLFHLVFSSIRSFDEMKNDTDFSVVPEEYLEKVKNSNNPQKTWKKIVQHELFYDPNKAPKSIEAPLNALTDLLVKYIYSGYMFTDRMYKLKNFRRNVVTVIDTDSNILSLDPWIEYCFTDIMQGDYGRKRIDNIFININTVTFFISRVISMTLDLYGRYSNISKDYRWRYQMKNEFFFSKLILANVKKRYLSKMLLQEGNLLTKPKYDIKGYDFRKASTSDETAEFYVNIVKNELLESDNINVGRILSILKKFRKEIKESIQRGEIKYLPLGSPKELESYVDPRTEQSIRAVFAWNNLYPENIITVPAKVAILKTKLYTQESAEPLREEYPDIYEKLVTKIYSDKTGMFVKTTSSGEKIEGLSVIAIPQTEQIPEWLIPHIDYMTVINAVLAPFKSVTETFGLPSLQEGPTGRKSVGFSNIVRF